MTIFRFPKPSWKSEVWTRFFFIKSQNAILRTPEQPEQPFSDYIDYLHTLSYYRENGRNPYNTLSKIDMYQRYQPDPCRCSWNVEFSTFHFYNFQISKTFLEVQSPDKILFSILDFLRMYIPRTPEQPFSTFIDYSLPCLIMGKMYETPINPCLKSLPAEGGN